MAVAALSTQLAFDYGDMSASDSKALERHADAVLRIQERQRKTTAENFYRLGEELKSAQEKLSNHGNGTFGRWCLERCETSRATACKAIRLYEEFSARDRKQYLQSFDASAACALLSDTCPEEALADALKLAKKGEVVTHKRAKELIASHTVGDLESDDEGENDDSAEDAPDSFDWQPADFVTSTRKHVRQWIERCPADELHYIYETLRDLAAQIERKQDGSSDA
jgi:hypothetical protein